VDGATDTAFVGEASECGSLAPVISKTSGNPHTDLPLMGLKKYTWFIIKRLSPGALEKSGFKLSTS
jgi:hypothetical protein